MEQTPFDPFNPPPQAPSTVPYPPIGANLPPSRPPKKSPLLLLTPLALILLLVAGGLGFAVLQKKQERERREEKLAGLRADIKKVVLQDNALVMEMLDDGALEHITYAEFFKRADKNKEGRDDLIRQLRATETGPYGEDVGHYVALLGTENDWVRSEEAVTRAGLDASTKWDAYNRALKQSSEASGGVEASYSAYLAAPYGSDFSQKMDYDLAKARLNGSSQEARTDFSHWSGAQDDVRDKKRAASVVITDWLRAEPLAYLNFAPKRDVSRLLIARKADYDGALSGSSSSSAPSTPSAQIVPLGGSDSPSQTPSATPKPSFPTRIHAQKPLDGERFPQTRTDDLSEEVVSNLGDGDLRYAINEMYARYGMTFKDKSLQSQFEQTTWYRPNDAWTMPQVEAAFSPREHANLASLVSERASRRQGNANAKADDSKDDNSSSDNSSSDDNASASGNSSDSSDDHSSSSDDSSNSSDRGSSSDDGKRNVEADG